MARTVTVEMDEVMYRKLEWLTEKDGGEPKDTLVQAVEAYLARREAYVEDPFFQIGKGGRSDLGDLAEAHDRYFYGAGKDK